MANTSTQPCLDEYYRGVDGCEGGLGVDGGGVGGGVEGEGEGGVGCLIDVQRNTGVSG